MTSKRVLLLLPLLVFALGCPSGNEPYVPPPPDYEVKLGFGYRGDNRYIPIEAGIWGRTIWILSVPEFIQLPRSKAILKGPGRLYYVTWEKDPSTGNYIHKEIPWEEIADTYYSNGMSLVYRPPSNEEVPPEGVNVTFACEVLNPFTEKWDRSPNYTMRLVRRDKPMDFWLNSTFDIFSEERLKYGPDNSFSEATLVSGEAHEDFPLYTRPLPAEDFQLQTSLAGLDGYTGPFGTLVLIWEDSNLANRPTARGYKYTAPAGLAEPVDIVARFSIYDPWAKETRTRELTFHVVPKE